MSEHSDPVDELLRHSRYVLTAAARVGQTLINVRQQQQQRAAQESQERSRQLAREIAQREQEARVRYRYVESPEWWQQARPEQVAEIYQDAVAFAGSDPAAAQARQRIETEAATRYGVDLRELDPSAAGPALAQAAEHHGTTPAYSDAQAAADLAAAEAADQVAAEQLRVRAAGAAEEAVVDRGLAAGADQADRGHDRRAEQAPSLVDHVDEQQQAGADAAVAEDREGAADLSQAAAAGLEDQADAGSAPAVEWDSPERRQGTEQQLRDAGVPADAVKARMLADVSQAKPARDGVQMAPRSSAKARPSRGQSVGREQEQGLSR